MSIDNFKLDKKIIEKLKNNGIDTIEKLKSLNRAYLKELGFNNENINLIIINLQLMGYDLKKSTKKQAITN